MSRKGENLGTRQCELQILLTRPRILGEWNSFSKECREHLPSCRRTNMRKTRGQPHRIRFGAFPNTHNAPQNLKYTCRPQSVMTLDVAVSRPRCTSGLRNEASPSESSKSRTSRLETGPETRPI